jgi:hypothetical protein
MPAHAGIQFYPVFCIPACAGMTTVVAFLFQLRSVQAEPKTLCVNSAFFTSPTSAFQSLRTVSLRFPQG